MDLTDEITFGDLQRQKRFRKLQREMKLTRIKQSENLPKANSGIPAGSSPGCSSINTDPSDFNSTISSFMLQTSRTCSEVLTSSRHLRNLVSKSSILYKPMAASSVKKFSETEQTIDDRAIMPPPSNSNLIRPPAKRPALVNETTTKLNRLPQSTFLDVNCKSIDCPEDSECAEDQSRGKSFVRDFYRWRVCLNNNGQLLIKGALENGKIVRSKPVLKVLSSKKVESIYKYTYCLHGNITDEKNELPKYIYTKFFNGFPDDWENVHQVWKDFVAQGCKESYRWPRDVSFSDDDLNSEITDITHIHQNGENTFQESNSINKSTPQRSSGYSSDFRQEWNSKSNTILSRDVNLNKPSDFSRRNQTNQVLSFPEKENRCLSGNRSQLENRSPDQNRSLVKSKSVESKSMIENKSPGENRSGDLYTVLNYAHILKDFIFEDKLKIITQNLLSENCPREYISYVNQTTENLNYLLSYKVVNSNESLVKCPRLESKNNSLLAEVVERNCSKSQFKEPMSNVSIQVSDNKVVEKRSNFEPRKRKEEEYEENPNLTSSQILSPQISNPEMNCDFSESETYTGVPKISADRIFQSKPYHSRYKERKLERNFKSNKSKLMAENCKNNLNYDSCLSLTEDEILKDYGGGKARSNLYKTQVFGGNPDWNPNSARQNCMPLENPNAILNPSNANLIPSDSEKRKTRSDMENIQSSKQIAEASFGKQNSTIANSEMCERLKRPRENQFLNFESDDNQEQKEKDEGLKNHFLKSSETHEDLKKRTPGNLENSGNDYLGSEKNPKLLTSWTPVVTFDGKDHRLFFEGVLLNALGRFIQKKFTSNHVVRRVSSKIIETADHQFYKLTGDLRNSNHVVPKELWSQCRNGCPTNIDNFCAAWIKLARENNAIAERPQKTVVELPKTVPSSSRGRRILPPLSYWADERVVMKDNNAVYKPGEPKNHFVSSGINSPKKPRGPLSSNDARKDSSNSEQIKCPENDKVAHKLTFSSSDSEDTQEKINPSLKRNRSLDVNESLSGSRKKFSREKQNSSNPIPYTLRKRQKIEHKVNDSDIESDTDSIPGDNNNKANLSGKSRTSQVRWTLKRNISAKDAFLSDDQLSMT